MQVEAASTRDLAINSKMPEASLRLSGQAGLGVKPSTLAAAAPLGGDSVSGLLQQLATPRMASLIGELMMDSFMPTAPAALELMQSAIHAVTTHDVERALDTIAELLVRHPKELEAVRTEPVFASIRGVVENLLQRHVVEARTDSERKLSFASHTFETFGPRPVRDLEKDVPQILSVAQQLLDTDRHSNVLLAGNLAQYVVNFYAPVAVAVQNEGSSGHKGKTVPQSASAGKRLVFDRLFEQVLRSFASIRERVPPKLLLLAWFAIGLMSGLLCAILRSVFEVEMFSAALPLEIWGAGSVGLVGFGTYRRMKKA